MSKQTVNSTDHNGDELFMARVTNKAFIFDPQTKKYLFARAADMPEEYWKLIGGRMRRGEELEEALHREIVEEIGKDVKYEVKGTLGVTTVFEKGEAINIVAYLVFYREGEIVLNDEHSEYKWLSLQEALESKCIAQWAPPLLKEAEKRMQESEYLNDLKRLQADFENYKKRQAAEAKEFSSHLAKSIVSDLIPVLDNLHAAAEHVPADLVESPWVKGITYIEKQFEDALKNYGVVPIEVKPGDAFNPLEHEAVDYKEAESPEPVEGKEGKESKHLIEKVVQKGYKVGERVIKAARVTVR